MTYGLGTRSYNRSTEARQNKKAVKEFTEKLKLGEVKVEFTDIVTVLCTCPQRPWPHELSVHRLLRYENRYAVTNEPVMKWPWTLRFLGDMEEI